MSIYKKVILSSLLTVIFFIHKANAQMVIGGGTNYQYKTLITTQQFNATSDINGEQGWEVHFARRFQIGGRQIFFMPTLNYGQGERLKSQYGITGWMVLYPFILNEDCDCPTFGSKTNWFKRSFNIALGPTLQRTHFNYSDAINSYALTGLASGLSLGLGWDIEISSGWYIQPFINGMLLFDASIFELTPLSTGTEVDYVNTENYIGSGGLRLRF